MDSALSEAPTEVRRAEPIYLQYNYNNMCCVDDVSCVQGYFT